MTLLLYDKSIKLAALLPNSSKATPSDAGKSSILATGTMPSKPSVPEAKLPLGDLITAIPTSTAPSISGIVTLQENSITSVATATKRFHSF